MERRGEAAGRGEGGKDHRMTLGAEMLSDGDPGERARKRTVKKDEVRHE